VKRYNLKQAKDARDNFPHIANRANGQKIPISRQVPEIREVAGLGPVFADCLNFSGVDSQRTERVAQIPFHAPAMACWPMKITALQKGSSTNVGEIGLRVRSRALG